MEHYWWCTEGDDCVCDPDLTEDEFLQAERDRLMNERARLILDGVDPARRL